MIADSYLMSFSVFLFFLGTTENYTTIRTLSRG